MSYKIRNWSTSNCGTNPSSAVGDCTEVTVSITRSRDAHGGNAQVAAGGEATARNVCVIRSTEKEEERLRMWQHLKAGRNLRFVFLLQGDPNNSTPQSISGRLPLSLSLFLCSG